MTNGTRFTPSSRRQRSTALGSGPASTTTPVPSPVLSTSASPCPTSHITASQPGGGQPVSGRVSEGGRIRATASTRASAHSTSGRRNAARISGRHATVDAASARPPNHPPGHATVAPGTSAPIRATAMIHAAGSAATCTSATATGGHNDAASSARNPSTVAGATASSASRLQGTATRLTRAVNVTTTGAQTAWAAHGSATATASARGQPRRTRASAQRGASSSNAAVASTDRMKPKLRARCGANRIRTRAAAASADGPCRRRPKNRAASVTRPMSAARSTLGSGRARTTKPRTATTPATGSARPRTPAWRRASNAAPSRIVTLVPLTASRCVSSVVLKSRMRSGGSRPVSPTTRPGRRPRGPAGRPAHASRSRARRCPAHFWYGDASPTTRGADSVMNNAAVGSPGFAGTRRPVASRRVEGNRCCHACASRPVASNSTEVRRRCAAKGCTERTPTSTSMRAGTRTAPVPRDVPRTFGATGLGSPTTVTRAVTVAACAARAGTGPARPACAAADAAAAAAQTSAIAQVVRTTARGPGRTGVSEGPSGLRCPGRCHSLGRAHNPRSPRTSCPGCPGLRGARARRGPRSPTRAAAPRPHPHANVQTSAGRRTGANHAAAQAAKAPGTSRRSMRAGTRTEAVRPTPIAFTPALSGAGPQNGSRRFRGSHEAVRSR